MYKISKKELMGSPRKLPRKTGVLQFLDNDKVLYITITGNIRRKYEILSKSADKYGFQMLSLTDMITYQTYESLFESFLKYKEILSYHHPEYNRLLADYSEYIYLSISFDNPPYFKISDQTIENHLYLGPFRNRFFPHDFLDIMNDLYKYPICESETYPCDLLKFNKCSGLCLSEKKELVEVIIHNYILVNDDKIKELKLKINAKENDIKFKEADEYKQKLKIVEKFYDHLYFLHITKQLDIENDAEGIIIKNGLLTKCSREEIKIDLPDTEMTYRDNEFLAFNKNEYQERRIIYDHFKVKYPKLLKRIYLKSYSRLFELLSL